MNQGEKLRKAIKDKGLTQEDAAITLGMSRVGLSGHLKKAVLTKKFKEKLKALLDIDIEQETPTSKLLQIIADDNEDLSVKLDSLKKAIIDVEQTLNKPKTSAGPGKAKGKK